MPGGMTPGPHHPGAWTPPAGLLALLAAACSASPDSGEAGRPDPVPVHTPAPRPPMAALPGAAGPLAPAHVELTRDTTVDGAHLAQVEDCADCHPDVTAQWESSAHAFASFNNPIYRVSIQGFRERVGARASRFCGGCHDVALLVDGAMDDARAAPDGPPHDAFAPDDRRAHAGITCRMCHGIVSTRPDGNGSFTLGAEPIPLPREDDPDSVARHRLAVQRSPLGADLCITCHRSFLGPETGNGHHLVGMDDATDWQASAYTGSGTGRVDDPVPRADCLRCHMPREPAPQGDAAARDGTVASHRFLGGHTWLAAMRGDAAQLADTRALLHGAASLDIAAVVDTVGGTRTLPADGAPLSPSMAIDLVVRNLAVGHRFPGGVRDAQDVWIEVAVRDAGGALLAASGMAHEHDAHDAEAHVLRALVAGEDGALLFAREVDRFRAPIVDHTIAARDVAVVRYRLDLPAGVAEPLEIHARLRHRSRNLHLQAAACAETRSARGQAFDRGARRWRGMALDPCAPQPVTTMAERRVWIGNGWRARAGAALGEAAAPAWQRLYEHGLGWLHAVQERTDEARPSLMTALERLDDPAGNQAAGERDRQRAMVMTALGTLAGRQGRTDEALGWLDRAEALVPGHAAVSAARGAALARVWRWHEAVAPLSTAAARAPLNSRAQALLAVALGSVGDHARALDAARRGLALSPRHEDLLRVQALALAALDAPDAAAAMDAYERYRAPDPALAVRFACTARDPLCAREREPVHEHLLEPVGGPVPRTRAPALRR